MHQRPSIAGVVILCLFGLPFAGMGLAFAVVSSTAQSNGQPGAWSGILFGVAFSLIGFGLMAATFIGYKKANQQADIEEAHLDKPWLWKQDWAAGRANGRNPKTNIATWILTGIWDAISFTIAANILPDLVSHNDPRALIVAIFPLIGIILTVFAARGTLRTMRFGSTALVFDSAPFSPGLHIKGAIHLKLPTDVPHGFDLTLSCKRRTVTQTGKNQTVQETVLWQAEQNVPAQSIFRDPVNAQVPVDFALPPDAYVTDEDNSRDKVYWQLHAKADVPGVDFDDNYELPVFRTQSSSSSFETAQYADNQAAPPISNQFDQQELTAPPNTKVVCREESSGPSFYLPPLRSALQALTVFAVAAAWSGIVYMLWHSHAPMLFAVAFSIFELLVIYLLANAFFGTAMLRIREGALETRNAILGIGILHRIPYEDIASIAPLSQGQAVYGRLMFGIVVQTKNGREVRVASNSLSEREARWIVSRLEQALGLQHDTHPQFRSIYGAPPQPAGFNASIGAPSRVVFSNREAQSKAALIVPVIFLLFIGAIFASVFRQGARRGEASSTSNRRRTAVSLRKSPAQQQAEQTLARSIGHDEHALAQFEDNIGGWTSQLQFTDDMKRLEQRSRYSRDLRVRQANVDLNLAIEGWQRNQQAVDLLMQRAQTDKNYRAAAYYYLGMEGGRGVQSDKVFAFLKDRALHDQDPVARQWAVEGLQFFKTDEALDVLYQSFTTDASSTVRDRAGCNLSDCGIFTRAQRMRYVPRLIELSADPKQSLQMRSWTFMALNEITDASVPNDPQAWRNWYQQHGAAKSKEFAALPWYQVRGDE